MASAGLATRQIVAQADFISSSWWTASKPSMKMPGLTTSPRQPNDIIISSPSPWKCHKLGVGSRWHGYTS
ncbi:hypothetical protein [Escherichia coli]|uniref:hypothetical protein n=1 Tax=Escherichia coli TaxID=562 RepID=UPI003EEDF705